MNELKKLSTGELIPFESASLSTDIDNWLWTFNASLPDLHTLKKLKPARALKGDYVEISFKLGLQTFALIIEEADSNDTSNSFSVSGRSLPVLLAEPYSLPITRTWNNVMASDIAHELCDDAGIILNWGVLDWRVSSFIADKRYPIDIISELANDIGAAIQSLPNGTLAVVYDPVCSPNHLEARIPDFSVATDTNLFTRACKFINNTNYNRVLVTTESSTNMATAPSVSIEESVDGYDRVLSVFVNPFMPSDAINLHHSSGANVIAWYEGEFIQQNTDQLIIQDGKAQLSKPIDSLISVVWHQDIVGGLTIDNRGAIITDLGFGLATITYITRYHRWRFNNATGVNLTGVAIDEIATPVDVSALSLELATGDGNHEAPPVIVKTLSSLAALKARGESELWKQLYDADEYSIECAYQNLPILAGKVALVVIRNESLIFKGWIKSVSINIGSTITQQVTITRPLT